MQQATYLRIYAAESAQCHGKALYEGVLEYAKHCGVAGGTVFRSVAGYGRHGRVHEEHFFELAGELTVAIEFIADDVAITALLARLTQEGMSLFYVKFPAESGVT